MQTLGNVVCHVSARVLEFLTLSCSNKVSLLGAVTAAGSALLGGTGSTQSPDFVLNGTLTFKSGATASLLGPAILGSGSVTVASGAAVSIVSCLRLRLQQFADFTDCL